MRGARFERSRVEPTRRPYDIERLTDVALAVFARRGFDGASMDDVARAAGITKAAIYHHARSKEELLDRGLRRALEALEAVFDESGAVEGAAVDRLRYVVRRVAALAVEVLPELTVLVRVRGNTACGRSAIERRRNFDRRVSALVRAAQETGEVDRSLDARVAVRLIFGMCNSIVEWYRPGGALSGAAVAETVVRLVFDGALAPGARSRFESV